MSTDSPLLGHPDSKASRLSVTSTNASENLTLQDRTSINHTSTPGAGPSRSTFPSDLLPPVIEKEINREDVTMQQPAPSHFSPASDANAEPGALSADQVMPPAPTTLSNNDPDSSDLSELSDEESNPSPYFVTSALVPAPPPNDLDLGASMNGMAAQSTQNPPSLPRKRKRSIKEPIEEPIVEQKLSEDTRGDVSRALEGGKLPGGTLGESMFSCISGFC